MRRDAARGRCLHRLDPIVNLISESGPCLFAEPTAQVLPVLQPSVFTHFRFPSCFSSFLVADCPFLALRRLRLVSSQSFSPSHGVQIEGVVEKDAHLSAVGRKRP